MIVTRENIYSFYVNILNICYTCEALKILEKFHPSANMVIKCDAGTLV